MCIKLSYSVSLSQPWMIQNRKAEKMFPLDIGEVGSLSSWSFIPNNEVKREKKDNPSITLDAVMIKKYLKLINDIESIEDFNKDLMRVYGVNSLKTFRNGSKILFKAETKSDSIRGISNPTVIYNEFQDFI